MRINYLLLLQLQPITFSFDQCIVGKHPTVYSLFIKAQKDQIIRGSYIITDFDMLRNKPEVHFLKSVSKQQEKLAVLKK